jgi:hypothetical protein
MNADSIIVGRPSALDASRWKGFAVVVKNSTAQRAANRRRLSNGNARPTIQQSLTFVQQPPWHINRPFR